MLGVEAFPDIRTPRFNTHRMKIAFIHRAFDRDK
jgi:hypothetical protein